MTFIIVLLMMIQFKVLHRSHYSNQTSPLCNRCRTLAHQFWSCLSLQSFWCSIFRWYSCALKVNIDPDPETALFGYSRALENRDRNLSTVIAYGMVIAKRCILKLWKSDSLPQFETWLREFIGVLRIEKLRYEVSGNSQKFHVVWRPILDYMKL